MILNIENIKNKLKKRKEKFKRFKRNLRLAKRKTHFRVFLNDVLSSLKADAKNVSIFCLSLKKTKHPRHIFSRSNKKWTEITKNGKIYIKNPLKNIGYIYIKFYENYPDNIFIESNNKKSSYKCKFLHCLIDLKDFDITKNINLTFSSDVKINKAYIFTKGNLPNWVQKWNSPCEKADLLAMSTHSDDEQLFFAGVLPLYATKDKKIQVSYFAPPLAAHRYNELLDGLWQIGIKNYPIFAPFYEEWSTSIPEAKNNLSNHNTTEADIQRYIVSTIRKFKPSVVIGQDPINGEYGHGQHMYFAHCLEKYIKDSENDDFDYESAKKYGTHSVSKCYLHLHPSNQIILDLDTPMKELNGKSPFQKSQEGFSRHRSQYVAFFPRQLFGTIRHPITKASQIKDYSPCKWGLTYTNVGQDKIRTDMFENLK